MTTLVYLGNRDAIEILDDPADVEAATAEGRAPRRLRMPLPGNRCTTVRLADGLTLLDGINDIIGANGIWAAHSNAEKPAWVASTNPRYATILAAHYGCEIRDPELGQEG